MQCREGVGSISVLPTEKPGAERRRVFYGIMRSSLQHYSIKNPHIAQRCRVSLMPPPVRIGEANPVKAPPAGIGEANPGSPKLASALFHKKPAHRAAMPGFFIACPAVPPCFYGHTKSAVRMAD